MLDNISARDIAVSGLRAQRVRMNVIANNIANAETTRTPEGGAFRRQLAIFAGSELHRPGHRGEAGVKVDHVATDTSPFRVVFDPDHPDADKDGYVSYPNVNVPVEMVNLISAQRGYEANIAVLAAGARMRQASLDLLQ